MTAFTYQADLVADALQDGTLLPATVYLEVVTTTPTAGTPGTPSGLGRFALATATDLDNDGAGSLWNNVGIEFDPAAGDVGTPTYGELWDAVSGGHARLFGAIGEPLPVVTGQVLRIPIGGLSFMVT